MSRIGRTAGLFTGLCGATLFAATAWAASESSKTTPTPPINPTAPAAQAPAATTPQSSTSTATFDDWLVRCETRPPAPKVCEAAQAIAARAPNQQQQSVIAEVVFGRVSKSDPMKLIVQLPQGVWLPTGASFTVGDAPGVPLIFTRCTQSCVAEAELKPDFLQTLRGWTKTDPARLDFEDGAQRKVSLNISLKGLPAALAARDDQAAQ